MVFSEILTIFLMAKRVARGGIQGCRIQVRSKNWASAMFASSGYNGPKLRTAARRNWPMFNG